MTGPNFHRDETWFDIFRTQQVVHPLPYREEGLSLLYSALCIHTERIGISGSSAHSQCILYNDMMGIEHLLISPLPPSLHSIMGKFKEYSSSVLPFPLEPNQSAAPMLKSMTVSQGLIKLKMSC